MLRIKKSIYRGAEPRLYNVCTSMKLYRRQAEKDYSNIIHRKGFLSIQVVFSLIDDTA